MMKMFGYLRGKETGEARYACALFALVLSSHRFGIGLDSEGVGQPANVG